MTTRTEAEFDKIDANKDGVISKDEWKAYVKKGTKRTLKSAKKKTVTKRDVKSHKRRRHETFSVYIYKVLKQVHQDTGISKRSMSIMNSFVFDYLTELQLKLLN